ncbi:MAG: hypothetical protein KF773_30985 [Deltaproteobacteria bacterium]|nr:hypothetical protein [Deltaproteobacteria bacterium]MCW5803620.1 hypothetical protein [Deltaproteobacteria bacterium]
MIVHAVEGCAQTLEACNAFAPPSRTFAVVPPFSVAPDLRGRADHVFCQPAPRGTGLGVYVALAMIRRWQPGAFVTVVSPAAVGTSAVELHGLRTIAARSADRVAVLDHVACGTLEALWELGRRGEPGLLDILDSLVPLVGTRDEDEAIDYIYRAYLPVNFADDIVRRAADRVVPVTRRPAFRPQHAGA